MLHHNHVLPIFPTAVKKKKQTASAPSPQSAQGKQPTNTNTPALFSSTVRSLSHFVLQSLLAHHSSEAPFGKSSASKTGWNLQPSNAVHPTPPPTAPTYNPSNLFRAARSSLLCALRGCNLGDGCLHLHDPVYPPGSSLIG